MLQPQDPDEKFAASLEGAQQVVAAASEVSTAVASEPTVGPDAGTATTTATAAAAAPAATPTAAAGAGAGAPTATAVTVTAPVATSSGSASGSVGSPGGDTDLLPAQKRRKKQSSLGGAPPKELTTEQKLIVKMNVTREATTDGVVKCCYCEKEITSKNVDRWASHLRGCLKTPENVKAQIQPFRPAPGTPLTAAVAANAMEAAASAMGPHAHAHVQQQQQQQQQQLQQPQPPANVHIPILPQSIVMAHAPASAPPQMSTGYGEVFKVHVSKDYMKFNAAHFIAYKGFREKLHGHNYQVAVTITGTVGADGYVVDFGEIKKIARVICKGLNESFIVPMNSDALKISFDATNVHIVTEDMAKFSFPRNDCSLLPIVHSSAEELAVYFSNQLVDAFTMAALVERGVRKLEVSIAEAHQQMAAYERSILASA